MRPHLLLLLFAAALAACDREAPKKPAGQGDSAAIPAPPPGEQPALAKEPEFPTLSLSTFDGQPWDLAAHRGKWVVVNFWATWCSPCLKEMPELSALDAMREHVEVIGLTYEDIDPTELQLFLLEHPVAYPIAIVDVYAPPADFATPRGLPMTYLIAPDGKVAKKFLGPVTAAELEQAIAAAGGPPMPKA